MYENARKEVMVFLAIAIAVLLAFPALAAPNPAALYCTALGFDYEHVKNPDTSELGVCHVDGIDCAEWDFYSGKCAKEKSACAKAGYQTLTASDGEDPYASEYAVCLEQDAGNSSDLITGFAAYSAESEGIIARFLRWLGSYMITGHATAEPFKEDRLLASEVIGLADTVKEKTAEYEHSGKSAVAASSAGGTSAPTTFDWRDYNGGDWLTPVRDQASCGSCWAFCSLGATEAVFKIARNDTNFNPDLSEQELVSTCSSDGDCDGGYHYTAMSDYIKNNGITDEACMPYLAANSDCTQCVAWNQRKWEVDDSSYYSSPTDAQTKQYLIDHGPLAVNYCVNGAYDGDIYRCTGEENPTWFLACSGHCVTLVGYNDTGQYWILKNSWGTGYQDSGYFKMGYGECGVVSSIIGRVAYASKTWPNVTRVANVTNMTALNGSTTGMVSYMNSIGGGYVTMTDGCSGGNCNGTDIRLNFTASDLPHPFYIDIYANERSTNAGNFEHFYMTPIGYWNTLSYIPQDSIFRLMKYRICDSQGSCASVLSNTTEFMITHSACTSCSAKYADIDWFAIEADIDTDFDHVSDSNDRCVAEAGTFCSGCPTQECGICGYNYCPVSGLPHCTNWTTDYVCNTTYACASAPGDNNYNTTGEYLCKGFCDGTGSCDYAGDCSYNAICDTDDDNDGVPDIYDNCTNSTGSVDSSGCNQSQIDADMDGVCDPDFYSSWCSGSDECPSEYGPSCNGGCPDTTPPQLEILSPVSQEYATSYILVNLSSSDICLDTTWFFNGTDNVTFDSRNVKTHWFQKGNTTFHAYANDTSGNINHTTVNFRIAFRPEINVSPNMTYSPTAGVIFNVSVNETVQQINATVNSTDIVLCNDCSADSSIISLGEGWSNVTIKVLDYANETWTRLLTVFVDSIAPVIHNYNYLDLETIRGTSSTVFSVNYTETNVDSVVFTLNTSEETVAGCSSGAHKVCSVTKDLSAYPDGSVIGFYFTVTDIVGTGVSLFGGDTFYNLTIDRSGPVITFNSPANNSLLGYNFTLDVSVDELAEIAYSLDNSASVPLCSDCTSGSTGFTGLDLGAHSLRVTARDDAGNTASGTLAVTVAPDFDMDGIPDKLDPDDDNDGVPDSDDKLLGNNSHIDTNLGSLTIEVNGSADISKGFNTTLNVTIKDSTLPVVEFAFDFGAGTLNLSNVTVQKQNNSNKGSLLIKGIDLGSGNKTVYVDDIDASVSTLCIKDAHVARITEVDSRCEGAHETYISCPGSAGNYTCSVNGSKYRVTGLRHSGILELFRTSLTGTGGSGGGGGGGSYTQSVNIYPTVSGEELTLRSHSLSHLFHMGEIFEFRLTKVGFIDVYFSIGQYDFSLSTLSSSVDIDTNRDGMEDLTVQLRELKGSSAVLVFRTYLEPEQRMPMVMPANYSRPRTVRQMEMPVEEAKEEAVNASAAPSATPATAPVETSPVDETPSPAEDSRIMLLVQQYRGWISGIVTFLIILSLGLFLVSRASRRSSEEAAQQQPAQPVQPEAPPPVQEAPVQEPKPAPEAKPVQVAPAAPAEKPVETVPQKPVKPETTPAQKQEKAEENRLLDKIRADREKVRQDIERLNSNSK